MRRRATRHAVRASRLEELEEIATLRIATYNVHGCVGSDGVLDTDRVARVIVGLDCDIVGLQEVDCRRPLAGGMTQLEHLAVETNMAAVPGPTIVEHNGFYGNALLTRFAVRDVERTDLSVAGREPRGMLEVRLGHAARLRVLVTHFGLRAAERSRQVDALLARVSGREPLVVLGDFNEWHPRAAALLRLHAVLGRTPPLRTFPSRLPVFALDRIWVRPIEALVAIARDQSPLARRASDHLPIYADLDGARLFGLIPRER